MAARRRARGDDDVAGDFAVTTDARAAAGRLRRTLDVSRGIQATAAGAVGGGVVVHELELRSAARGREQFAGRIETAAAATEIAWVVEAHDDVVGDASKSGDPSASTGGIAFGETRAPLDRPARRLSDGVRRWQDRRRHLRRHR